MTRTTFLVDGFNLYHSLRAAADDLGGRQVKWLNISSLLSSYLYVIGAGASLAEIYYFSALADHVERRKPGVTARHRAYLECLEGLGVKVCLGRFKSKAVYCSTCRRDTIHFEEKETDVAISAKLLELLHLDRADSIVLVTGDTDLAPAVRTARTLFPLKVVCFGFPYRRKNNELARLVPHHFHIRKVQYLKHQLPNPFVLPNGRSIAKPASW